MFPVLPFIVVIPTKLNGGRFTIGTYLSASILSFVNINTGSCSAPYFTSVDCDVKDPSVDEFSLSFSLQDYVAFLYSNIM